jgi:acyl-coenzyme A synthetase/AMP-(fatty) acid ligase
MVMDADVPREDLSSLAFIIAGAAPLDPSVQKAFEARYGVALLPLYGATEFGGPVAFMTPQLHAEWIGTKLGSVGRPYAGAKLRVIDAATGEELPAGQVGILEIMSPRLGDYWVRTSDMALIDADGFLFINGRADGAINRGGFKVLPDSIERALKLHPAISAAGVTAIADRRLGQVPAVAIQFKPGLPSPSISELKAHLREHVVATHIPVEWKVVESLPYTPAMKIDRVSLRRMFEPAKPN